MNKNNNPVNVFLKNYDADYDQGSHEYGDIHINGHQAHPQTQPLPHTWNQRSQDQRFTQGDYTHTSMGTEKSTETNDFSTVETYENKPYPPGTNIKYNGEGGNQGNQDYRDHSNPGNHFQVSDILCFLYFIIAGSQIHSPGIDASSKSPLSLLS